MVNEGRMSIAGVVLFLKAVMKKKSRFLSSVVSLFLNNKQSIVLFLMLSQWT